MFEERLLRLEEVLQKTGLSKAALYRLLEKQEETGENLFPRSRHIGKRAVGWLLSEIIEWVKSRPVKFYRDDKGQTPPA